MAEEFICVQLSQKSQSKKCPEEDLEEPEHAHVLAA